MRGRSGLGVWYREQDPGVKAAVITILGSLAVALVGAAANLVVALISVPGDGPPTAAPAPAVVTTGPADPEGSGRPATSTGPTPTATPTPTRSASDTPPPTADPTDAPPPTPPEPSREDPPEPTPPAPRPVRVRWQGELVVDGSGYRAGGWFLDSAPPSRAPLGDLGPRGTHELYGPYALVAWSGARSPSRQQCVELLNSRPGQNALDVQVGDTACVGTENGRVARLTVTGFSDPDRQITVAVTVWERP
ncbi:hypothetical protein [Streptomyces sp. NRRL S-87]|uniref:hypothetical protein n=1 Tax=Streptomyces sp. NRRL S-87 TaxID=1463920 RepID=UPI00131E2279|nr:hypothetical protein [Streptomyces sp. NRRL S-87]